MSASRDDTLRQFCDVTGATEERSKFFLDSSNWQLDLALSSFYEHGGNIEEAPAAPARPGPVPQAYPLTLSDSDMESPPHSPAKPKKKEKKKSDSKFATIHSLQQDSSSDEEEGQAFYAGGSERSGQQILGPGKGNKRDIVTEMFKSVREQGAVVFEDEPSTAGRGRGGVFSGAGYRLGQTADDHEQVSANTETQRDQSRSVRLCMYREGFTVDNGTLRLYADPENAKFLSCIRQGTIPPELSEGAMGGEVRVSIEDRKREECPRNVKAQAFSGQGRPLGSPTPTIVGVTPAVAVSPDDREADQAAAQVALNLDDSQPITNIQIRLADGSRLTGRFNHTHTVGDLHDYVTRATQQRQAFVLVTIFPSTELTDKAKSIKEENLLNSTVMQRLR